MIRHRSFVLLAVFVLICAAGSGMWVWSARRQYARSRQLIDALVHHDTNQALVLVEEGADPNTRLNPPPNPSLPDLLHQFLHPAPPPLENNPNAFLLACGASCEVLDSDCVGPLVHTDTLTLVQTMFLHGANVNVETLYGGSALYMAAAANQPRVAEWLLAHHAKVNAMDIFGDTPLMKTVQYDHPNLTRLLLAHGADINAHCPGGDTELHLAVVGNMDKDIIRLLLEHGANPNLPDKYGQTPIKLAQKQKRLDIVDLLRHKGK